MVAAVGVLVLAFVMNAATGRGLNRAYFLAAVAFLLFILFQIRPDVFLAWGMMDAIFLAPGVAVLLAASTLPATNSQWLYKTIYVVSASICVAWIALHLMGVYPSLLIFPPYAGTRWVGGFDGPNEFGQFYVLIMALGFGLYLEGKIKLLYLILSTAVFAICVWYSFSRGALIAVAMLGAVVVFLNSLGTKRWRLLFVGAGVLAFGSVYFDRFATTFLNIRKGRGGRDDLLERTLDAFEQNPIFGGGFGYFASLAGPPPHSDYMYFLVSAGIIGLVILFASYGYLLWGSYRRGMYAEFLFFFVFAVHSLSFNNLVRGRLSLIFWLVTCVALVKF
ncbi:MAG: O-antigen ligase family protein, partial [Brevundimonas sp.]|nr:O-antigen ligase family protein [Brevundimonas sp.]